jgi:hypothetical protein
MDEGKYVQAEELLTQTLEIRRRVLGPEHYQTARAIYYLGSLAAPRRQGQGHCAAEPGCGPWTRRAR